MSIFSLAFLLINIIIFQKVQVFQKKNSGKFGFLKTFLYICIEGCWKRLFIMDLEKHLNQKRKEIKDDDAFDEYVMRLTSNIIFVP